MPITNSSGARDPGEYRRLRAWELKQKGWSQVKIAEALGVTEGAVSQWCKAARGGGVEALLTRKAPGPPPKLTKEQKSEIPALLLLGTEHYGFQGERWTCKRIGVVIQRHFGVKYHHSHISKVMADLGWSPQIPTHRSNARDDEKVEQWVDERWPEIKKKPGKRTEQ